MKFEIFLSALTVINFFGLVYVKSNPNIEGEFMVSSINGDGTIENTVHTDNLHYNNKRQEWTCNDPNTSKEFLFKDNIIIEKVYHAQ